jgi:hypothetical protein
MKRYIGDVIDQILLITKIHHACTDELEHSLNSLKDSVYFSAPEIINSNRYWISLANIITNNFPPNKCTGTDLYHDLNSIIRSYYQFDNYNQFRKVLTDNLFKYYSLETIKIVGKLLNVIESHTTTVPMLASYKISDHGIQLYWLKDNNKVKMTIISNELIIIIKNNNQKIQTIHNIKSYSQNDGILCTNMEDLLVAIKLLKKWSTNNKKINKTKNKNK